MDITKNKEIVKEISTELFGLDEHAHDILNKIHVYLQYPKLFTTPLIITLVGPTGTGKTMLARRILDALKLRDRSYYINVKAQRPSRWAETFDRIVTGLGYQTQDSKDEHDAGDDDEVDTSMTVAEFIREVEKSEENSDAGDADKDFYGSNSFKDETTLRASRKRRARRSKKEEDKTPKPNAVVFLDDMHGYKELSANGEDRGSSEGNMLWRLFDEGIGAFTADGKFIPTIIFNSMNLGLTDDESVENWQGRLRSDQDTVGHHYPLDLIMARLSKMYRPESVARFRQNFYYFQELSADTGFAMMEREFSRISENLQQELSLKEVIFEDSVKDILFEQIDFRGMGGRGIESIIDSSIKNDVGRWLLQISALSKSPEDLHSIRVSGKDEKYLDVQLTFEDGKTHKLESVDISRPQARKKTLDPQTLTTVSTHEAAHCLVHYILRGVAPEKAVVGLTNGEHRGYSQRANIKREFVTRQDIYYSIMIALAGPESELLLWGEDYQTAGSASDIKHATQYAISMILSAGFGSLPTSRVVINDMWQERHTLAMNDRDRSEIESLMMKAKQETRAILVEYKDDMLRLAKQLYNRLELNSADITEILTDVPVRHESKDYAATLLN
jgi:hypothetical protein